MKLTKNHRVIEALIFASTEPIPEEDIFNKVSKTVNVKKVLTDLKKLYSERGVNLVKTGKNWSFRTAPDLFDNLIIVKKQKRKLSRAAIEVLAIIAYHQPITRAEIENIRGVQMGRGSIDILVEIGWIKPRGRRNSPGRPITWVTTDKFLDHFSLEKLDNLPDVEELKSSGFLDKRLAIAKITDKVNLDLDSADNAIDATDNDDSSLEDFITPNN